MKNLILVFSVFSMSAFGQHRNLATDIKDSLAIKNTNAILANSKKYFAVSNSTVTVNIDLNSNLNMQNYSEMNRNTDQLLINTVNFNTAIYSRPLSQLDMVNYDRFRFNMMDLVGIPVKK